MRRLDFARLAMLGLSALLCARAVAQETAPPPPPPPPADERSVGLELEVVTVTAQRREESINDVPIAISAFNGETLQAIGVTDTRDLGVITPGFTAADSGYNTPVYTLRGIGFNDSTYTATSTVGVYVDEVSLPYSIMTKGANIDIDRVEILKGPQGTLYGRNTTGGAINYIARKPTDVLEYGLSAGYGSFQAADVEGFVSGPLTSTLRGRIAMRGVRSWEGWQKSQTRPDDRLGKQNKQSGRGALEWRPDPDLFFRLTFEGWGDRSDSQAPQAIYINPDNPLFNPNSQAGAVLSQLLGLPVTPFVAPQVKNAQPVDANTDDVTIADWPGGLDWRLNDRYWAESLRTDWNLSERTTLTFIASHGDVDSDGSKFSQSGLSFINAEEDMHAGIRTSAGELRLSGKWHADNHWLIGVNDAYDSGTENHHVLADTVSALFPDPVTGQGTLATRFNVAGTTHARALGVFANGDVRLLDPLRLTLGARYSDEHRTFESCSQEAMDSQAATVPGSPMRPIPLLFNVQAAERGNPTFPETNYSCIPIDANGSNAKYHGRLDESNVSGRAALDWTPLDDILFYVSYTRGFKSGGFPVANSTDQMQYHPVQQERLLAWELGGKLTPWAHVLHLNFAAFHYDYEDKQLLTRFMDPTFGPLPILRNAPKSHVDGAELDLQLTPIHGLFLSAAASYIDTRIDEFISTTTAGQENFDFSGRPFNFAPRLQYTVLGDYSLPVWRFNLGFGADYSYTGPTNSTLEGDPRYAHRAFGLTNARVRLGSADMHWNLMLWGRNVFDRFSQIAIFQAGDTIARYTGQPRTFGATLSYNGF